jgi:lipopolysaccharide/colanic/teichoic acid biosynthesis glycosyltransferase
LLAPMLCLVALAIRLESPGSAIFRQRRNGFNGLEFVIFKFRTMFVVEDGDTIAQARKRDPRVTKLGGMLRRWSIDELPQLLNVLRGDMSLVGPRPHARAHDTEYSQLVGNYAFRHHVKPGLTGWAQIHGLRGETATVESMAKRIEYDLWYINNWSALLDVRIVLRTCAEMTKGGAY